MNYPIYVSGETPITARDLNRLREQLRAQAQVWVAPPLAVVRDNRGISIRSDAQPASAGPVSTTITAWVPALVYAKTTDVNGKPLYICRTIVLHNDGSITDPGNQPQYVHESSNSDQVDLPSYQWIQDGTVFFDDLPLPSESSVWSSDYRAAVAAQAIPLGGSLVSDQSIPGRLFLTLSNLYGCGNISGTQIQLDLQNVQVTDLFGESGYGDAHAKGPCNPTFAGDVQNQDVQDLLTIQEFGGFLTMAQWAWFGGRSNPDGSIWSAVLLYTPGLFFEDVMDRVAITNFDRLAFQLYLLYRSRPTARPVVASAVCDSYYLPDVGSPADGFDANVTPEEFNPGTYDTGFAGSFTATFVLGYNSGGPCRGNIVCVVQGEGGETASLIHYPSRLILNNNLLGHDGGAGCDTAVLTIL